MYKSNFESHVHQIITSDFVYEGNKITYTIPRTSHVYTPDFTINEHVYLECKGKLSAQDRKKHLLIKQQHPTLTIIFVFMNPNNKIRKGSKTTYADWCNANGLIWCTIDTLPLYIAKYTNNSPILINTH